MQLYIINNNSFTMDTRNLRISRLLIISKNIEQYASELCLEQEIVDWAIDSYSNFQTAMINQSIEIGQKNELSKLSLEADANLYERYIVLKELLSSRYDDLKILIEYGIDTPTPTQRRDRYNKAKKLIDTHNRRIKMNDKKVLPQLMIDNLYNLMKISNERYFEVNQRKTNSLDKTVFINELFDEDSIKLRNLYNWTVAFWGKRDPRLYYLSFIPNKPTNGIGVNLNSVKITYNEDKKLITWNNLHNIQYYQVAYNESENSAEWIELGTPIDSFIDCNNLNGNYSFKLRAWTKNGFSNWSNEFKLTLI